MKHIGKRRTGALAIFGAIAMSVVGLSGPAAASPNQAAPNNGASIESGDYTAVEAPQWSETGDVSVSASPPESNPVDTYWTKERLERAIPVEPATPTDNTVRPDSLRSAQPYADEGERIVAHPSSPSEDISPRGIGTPVLNYSVTNGKLFFRNVSDGLKYVCSGSSVNGPSRRLVLTAGHCVHGGVGGTWHQNVVFIPGYVEGSEPRGRFTAHTLRTMSDWINYGETFRGYNSDVAFVTTYSNSSGRRVVDAVGGHGFMTGGTTFPWLAIFGYPVNRNGGEIQWACRGDSSAWNVEGYTFLSMTSCGFGGGASGGPWLLDYGNPPGLGYARSVSSWQYNINGIQGPQFDSRVAALYEIAHGDW